jgi:hypothetical protein
MNKLKDELRLKLLGQLSSEKTELDFEVCKKVSVSFSLFCAENYTHNTDSNYWWDGFGVRYTTEELFNKFLEDYGK